MINMLRIGIAIIIAAAHIACSSVASNSSKTTSNTSVGNSAISEEEKDKEAKEREAKVRIEQKKALSEFIQKNYKGWTHSGTEAGTASCDIGSPCDLHLTNGTQTKILSVVLKQFEKDDGTTYWLVFEARSVDLALTQIEQIKSKEQDATREYVLANLDYSDCENVIEQAREGDYELQDDFEDYDGRFRRGR
ncbi:MAG: hypothetical protein ACT4O9_06395 [Blastocatellia bacterium]